jgi:GTP cyclohydrolase II
VPLVRLHSECVTGDVFGSEADPKNWAIQK